MFSGNVRRIATVVTAQNDATSQLQEAEAAGDEVVSSMDDVEASSSEAGDSLDETGSSAEDTARDIDAVAESSDRGSDSFSRMEGAAVAASAAVVGLGTAMSRTLDQTQSLRQQIAIVEGSMEDSAVDITALATSLSNATFETRDAVQTLDSLAQMGVESEERMRELATTMDTFADANGTTATVIASDVAPTIRALDGDLDSVEESMDAMTFAARNSTMTIEDMNSTISRLDFSEMEEMGLQTQELSLLLAQFQEETGFTGRQLRSNFNTAIDEANGDVEQLYEELGLTQQQVEAFREEAGEAEGITTDLADSAGETHSAMDELRVMFSDARLRASAYLQPLSVLGPVLQSAGAAAMSYSSGLASAAVPATVSATAATWANVAATKAKRTWTMLAAKANWLMTASTSSLIAATWTKIAATKASAASMASSVAAAFTLSGAMGVLSSAKLAAAGAAMTLWTALGPIGLAVIGLTAAVAGLVAIWKTDFMGAGEQAGNILGWFSDKIDTTMDYVGLLGEGLYHLGRIFAYLAAAVTLGPIVALLKFFEDPGKWINAGKNAINGLISAFTDPLPGALLYAIPGVGAILLASKLTPDHWKAKGKEMMTAFASAIVPDPVIDAVTNVADDVMSLLPGSDADQGPLSRLTDAGAALPLTLAKAMLGNLSAVTDAASKIGSAVMDAVPGASEMRDAGAKAASSISDGLSSAKDAVSEKASDAASAVRDKMPFSDAKEGPLSDITSVGGNIANIIAGGLEQNQDAVGGAASAAMGAVTGAVDDTPLESAAGAAADAAGSLSLGLGGSDGEESSGGGTTITITVEQQNTFEGGASEETVQRLEESGSNLADDILAQLDRKLQADLSG